MLEWIAGVGEGWRIGTGNWKLGKEVILQPEHSGEGVSSRQEWGSVLISSVGASAPLYPLKLSSTIFWGTLCYKINSEQAGCCCQQQELMLTGQIMDTLTSRVNGGCPQQPTF